MPLWIGAGWFSSSRVFISFRNLLFVGRVWGEQCAHLPFWPGCGTNPIRFCSRTRRLIEHSAPDGHGRWRVGEQMWPLRAKSACQMRCWLSLAPYPPYKMEILQKRCFTQIRTHWQRRALKRPGYAAQACLGRLKKKICTIYLRYILYFQSGSPVLDRVARCV